MRVVLAIALLMMFSGCKKCYMCYSNALGMYYPTVHEHCVMSSKQLKQYELTNDYSCDEK